MPTVQDQYMEKKGYQDGNMLGIRGMMIVERGVCMDTLGRRGMAHQRLDCASSGIAARSNG